MKQHVKSITINYIIFSEQKKNYYAKLVTVNDSNMKKICSVIKSNVDKNKYNQHQNLFNLIIVQSQPTKLWFVKKLSLIAHTETKNASVILLHKTDDPILNNNQ